LNRTTDDAHLAPPFHPEKRRPSAPCPVCIQEKGENQPRDLFSIRGFRKGEYDEALADYWFITPPVKLDAAGGEMEALRVSTQFTFVVAQLRFLVSLRQSRSLL
jgi:hypothetical protein